MSLMIGPDSAARIHAHARDAYPEEGCGVLIGREGGDRRRVERVVALPNRREDSKHNRYLIAPEQFLDAEREARSLELDVVGFFHSHPDHPARPSAFDLEHAWPYYSYVIVSVENGRVTDMQSWRLADDRSSFEAERIETQLERESPSGH